MEGILKVLLIGLVLIAGTAIRAGSFRMSSQNSSNHNHLHISQPIRHPYYRYCARGSIAIFSVDRKLKNCCLGAEWSNLPWLQVLEAFLSSR